MILGGMTNIIIMGVSSNPNRNVMLIAIGKNNGSGRRASSCGSGGGSCSSCVTMVVLSRFPDPQRDLKIRSPRTICETI